jgi:folate-dependent phosphoribosylglycinamide formyltransferase PurN
VFHALEEALAGRAKVQALLEEPPSRLKLARRRSKKLGWGTVGGQVAFVAFMMPILRLMARKRVREIADEYGLDFGPIDGARIVNSVNDESTLVVLREFAPSVVVVHGTRIISDRVLHQFHVPFINVHVGITPRYRGVHGGYWALVESRPDLVGTTVHLVDAGIDTGGILGQATFEPTTQDTIATYQYLHLACGIPVLVAKVSEILGGTPPTIVPTLSGAESSSLRWHPTAWSYMATRVRRGVR